jgi:hypothetical protein
LDLGRDEYLVLGLNLAGIVTTVVLLTLVVVVVVVVVVRVEKGSLFRIRRVGHGHGGGR